MEVSPLDREKTTFTTFRTVAIALTTGSGLWQFTVIIFGLGIAPATFEQLVETVLYGLISKIRIVYLDDVVVFESTVDELLQRFCIVFEKLRGAGLKLSSKKCQLFPKEVCYLRFLTSEKELVADSEQTNAIATWPLPKDAHYIRSFLGLCSFVEGFAQIMVPLAASTLEQKRARGRLRRGMCSNVDV